MTSNSCSTQFIEYFMFHTTVAISKYLAILHEMAAPTHSNVQSSKATKRWAHIYFQFSRIPELRSRSENWTNCENCFLSARNSTLFFFFFCSRDLINCLFANFAAYKTFSSQSFQLNNVRIVRFRSGVHSCSKIIQFFSFFFFFTECCDPFTYFVTKINSLSLRWIRSVGVKKKSEESDISCTGSEYKVYAWFSCGDGGDYMLNFNGKHIEWLRP